MSEEVKRCKKCNKILPTGYKHKYCENCRSEQAHAVKNGIKAAGGIALSAVLLVVSAGKFGGKKS